MANLAPTTRLYSKVCADLHLRWGLTCRPKPALAQNTLCSRGGETQARGWPVVGALSLAPHVRSVPRSPGKTLGPRHDPVCVRVQHEWRGEGGRDHGLWKTNRDVSGF